MGSDAGRMGPLITDVKGNSLDDGPGIRSVVFFKGCPLNCYWCHNPESKQARPELLFDKTKCIRCMACVEACPNGARQPTTDAGVDRRRCTLQFLCVKACPSKAMRRVGLPLTVDEIVDRVQPFLSFFRASGGGVTLSGGEPTLFMDFCSRLLQRLKVLRIHTLVETCGLFDYDRFVESMLPHTDTIFMDIKIVDPAEHRKWCGVDNRPILENFARLLELADDGGFEILPRTPLIPGITDDVEKIEALAEFYQKLNVKRAGLMKNNPLWLDRLAQLGKAGDIPLDSPLREFYADEKSAEAKAALENRSVEVVMF